MEYLQLKDENIDESMFDDKEISNLNMYDNFNHRHHALEMIETILSDVDNVDNFYNILMLQAITQVDKELLKEIIESRHQHHQLLKKIYINLVNASRYTNNLFVLDTPNKNFKLNLESAMINSFETIKKYMAICDNLTLLEYKDALQRCVLDEMINLNKLNFLYLKNK